MFLLVAIPELGTSEVRGTSTSRCNSVGIGSFSGEQRSERTQEFRRMKARTREVGTTESVR